MTFRRLKEYHYMIIVPNNKHYQYQQEKYEAFSILYKNFRVAIPVKYFLSYIRILFMFLTICVFVPPNKPRTKIDNQEHMEQQNK